MEALPIREGVAGAPTGPGPGIALDEKPLAALTTNY